MGEKLKLKLVEVSEQEVCIDFKLGCKCRANINLKSIHATKPVAFKVQTSSPNSFLVNPPNGLIQPLQSTSFQVILKPQNHPPSSFPRSPSDRFLIRTAVAPDEDPSSDDGNHHHGKYSIEACFSSANATHDIKLRVVYVGLFLLSRAVAAGDVDAVKHMIKRRRPLVAQLPPHDAMAILQAASASGNVGVLNLLLQAGLHVGSDIDEDEEQHVQAEIPNTGNAEMEVESKGWTAIHAASAADNYEVLVALVQEAVREGWLDERDAKGRTALHVAASRGHARCVSLLIEAGCEKNARSNDGRTALFRAAANGDEELVALLVEAGADPSIGTSLHGHGPIDAARDKGHKDIVEILERGEALLTAARRGDIKHLESLIRKSGSLKHCDQYGLTALHSAAIKGHADVVAMLIEFGMDLECEDVEGHTPLHLAVEGGNAAAVEALISCGANVNARSKRGASPLYMATAMGYEAISQMLLARGAVASSSSLPSSASSSSTFNN